MKQDTHSYVLATVSEKFVNSPLSHRLDARLDAKGKTEYAVEVTPDSVIGSYLTLEELLF